MEKKSLREPANEPSINLVDLLSALMLVGVEVGGKDFPKRKKKLWVLGGTIPFLEMKP